MITCRSAWHSVGSVPINPDSPVPLRNNYVVNWPGINSPEIRLTLNWKLWDRLWIGVKFALIVFGFMLISNLNINMFCNHMLIEIIQLKINTLSEAVSLYTNIKCKDMSARSKLLYKIGAINHVTWKYVSRVCRSYLHCVSNVCFILHR